MNKEHRWLDVVSGSKEGQASLKKAESLTVDDRAGIVKVSYRLLGVWEGRFSVKGQEYDTLEVPDAGHMMIEGSPMIPQGGIYVAIPDNAEIKEIKVLEKEETELPGEYYILPSPKPTIEEEEDVYIPDAQVYESDEMFPSRDFELRKTEFVEDMKVAHIVIFLGRYRPRSRKLSVLKSIDLEISYEVLPEKPVKKGTPRAELKGLILNWDSIAAIKERG